ncbi:MAG: alpha/beta hydrolase, partial [Pseudomonadota bacterium]
MTAMLKRLKKLDKSTLNVPALFIYQPDDLVVVSEEIEKVADEWGGPARKVLVEKSEDPYNHVIAGDILSPGNNSFVTQTIVDWAKEL